VTDQTHDMIQGIHDKHLAQALVEIEHHDTDYDVRYLLVFRAAALALQAGYAAGIRIDPAEPAWPVVYIELPAGQVSWHMPQHPVEWDTHDTAEKYRRIRQFVRAASAVPEPDMRLLPGDA
jgi:hypothetical protein